ncbi:MAG: tetratricopeptide repeat protein [Deferrisomatales bacterium]|nr:tetratricopeptide repeat protein [Deferrisomatales bacterium]
MGSKALWWVLMGWLWCSSVPVSAALPEGLATHAAAGDARAQYQLGVAYAKGDGVEADDREAAQWFGRAAEGGDPEAMFALGMLYATGAGVALDTVLAHKWLHLCALLSDGEARQVALSSRNAVTAQMTPEQVMEAQELASDWIARNRVPTE